MNTPEWPLSVGHRFSGNPAAAIELETPLDPLSKSGSNPAPEVRPLDDYKQNTPVPNATTPGQSTEVAHEPVSLPNGTNIIPRPNSDGLGKITISNHSPNDAAVKLKSSMNRATVRFVYVRAMSDVTVAAVAPGDYVLQFSTGRDWDTSELVFRQDPQYGEFDKAMAFSEKEVADGTVYSAHTVTLHAVANGNVRKKVISANNFLEDRPSR